MTHFGSSPFDALYDGYFLDSKAIRQYILAFAPKVDAYEKSVLESHLQALRREVEVLMMLLAEAW